MNKDIIAWLGWVVASPVAVLVMAAFLLGACAPVALCPDLRCEYGYGEAPTEAPAPSPGDAPGDNGEGDDGKGDDGKGDGKGDAPGDAPGDDGKGEKGEKGEKGGDDD